MPPPVLHYLPTSKAPLITTIIQIVSINLHTSSTCSLVCLTSSPAIETFTAPIKYRLLAAKELVLLRQSKVGGGHVGWSLHFREINRWPMDSHNLFDHACAGTLQVLARLIIAIPARAFSTLQNRYSHHLVRLRKLRVNDHSSNIQTSVTRSTQNNPTCQTTRVALAPC